MKVKIQLGDVSIDVDADNLNELEHMINELFESIPAFRYMVKPISLGGNKTKKCLDYQE